MAGCANEDGMHSSWEDLNFLRESTDGLEHVPSSSCLHNDDMARILLDAQLESEKNGSGRESHCESPPLTMSLQSSPKLMEREPGNSSTRMSRLQSEEAMTLDIGSLCTESQDWVWEWASRLEHIPPREFSFKRHQHQQQFPAQAQSQTQSILSIQRSSIPTKAGTSIFSSEVAGVVIPSLLFSHLLTLGLGIYIGKRLVSSPTTL
ncbi:BCL2/adenovirus E1B 19 kDa protein-interacting protein 3-like [Ambystoma mexicanum]|uniref:BCL2/adenovirus E1B 19 kDa protein-interacting protein 3-like n=1 Tax=Ambystoma mexicanum TaxID=8296 RepID=UPI0037E7BB76